jgi:hypothetical protein
MIYRLNPLFKNIHFGKGKKCPACGFAMYAQSHEDQPMGTWVHYICRNGNCKTEEKVFEGK